MKQFMEAVLRGDDWSILSLADEALDYFNLIDVSMKWRFLIDRQNEYIKSGSYVNTIKDFSITWDSLLIKYDVKSEFLEPFDLRLIPLEHKATFDHRFKDQSPINGYTRAWNSIMIFYHMFGERMINSAVTQIFIAYLKLHNSEPFMEHGNGTVTLLKTYDASISLRVKLYIRTIWEEMTDKIPSDIITETFWFLFKNPQRNTLKLKNMKAKWLSCAFTRSTKGKMCQWADKSLVRFNSVDMPLINKDITTYLRLKDDLMDDEKDMMESGLQLLSARLKKMSGETVNSKSVGDLSTYWFIEALSGFLRSSIAVISTTQIAAAMGRTIYKEGNLMEGYYYDNWSKFMTYYVDKIPDTEEEFALNTYTTLTTRSNGMNDFIRVNGEYVNNPDTFSFNIDYNGRKMIWNVKDKALTFRTNPKRFFDYDTMINTLTNDDPGRPFTRYVPARNARLIYGMPLIRFVSEAFTPDLVDWLADQSYNGHPISTIAIDTGRYLTEMGTFLYYTGNPSEDVFILLSDFDQFDQSQNYANWRAIAVKACEKIIEDLGPQLAGKKFDLLGGRSPIEYLLGNWTTLHEAVFRIYTARATFVDVITDWEFSGEFSTLVTNTMVNYSFVTAFIDQMSVTKFSFDGIDYNLGDVFFVDQFKLQGDDQISLIRTVAKKAIFENVKFMFEAQSSLKQLAVDVAATGNLIISLKKTELRSGYFEFLKKAGIWGYAVPRFMQISLEESENLNRTMDPIERMRSRVGQYREYEFRGGNTVYSLLRRYMEWNIIRVVKLADNEEANLPFGLLWTPVSLGGVGMHPFTVVDPNVDIMISMWKWEPRTRKIINYCIQSVKAAPPKDNSELVSLVAENLKEGVQYQKTLDARVNSSRILLAIQAHEKLINGGMKPDKSAYHLRYEQEILEAVEDDKKMQVINVDWKRRRSMVIISTFADLVMDNSAVNDYLENMFIPGVRFTHSDIVQNDNLPFCPLAGLDQHLSMWLQQIGTSAEDTILTVSGFATLNKLLNRAGFPRNLKANNLENIAAKLLQNNLLELEQITDFLVMRGADLASALQVAKALAGKMDLLRHLSSVSAFSFVGEGFTDKSEKRIDELVSWELLDFDSPNNFSLLIKSLAYQYLRTAPLFSYINGVITTLPRRLVIITTDEDTRNEFIIKTISAKATTEAIKQQIRDTVLGVDNSFRSSEI